MYICFKYCFCFVVVGFVLFCCLCLNYFFLFFLLHFFVMFYSILYVLYYSWHTHKVFVCKKLPSVAAASML